MDRRELERLAREVNRDPRYLEQRENHRWQVIQRALIMTPGGLLLTGLLVFSMMHLPQSIIMVIVLGIAALAVDVEAIAALRDLQAQPTTTRGQVARSWKKARFLFFGRVHYLLVGRKLFEVEPLTGLELQAGDEVEVRHWPHTNVVITLERIAQAPSGGSGSGGTR